MFYTSEDIEQLLQCPICKQQFDVPKRLPCDQKICNSCEMKLIMENSDKFECPNCGNMHDNGLPVDSFVERLLKIKPKCIYRGEIYKNGIREVDGIDKEIDFLNKKLDNSKNTIKSHCDLVRNDVDVVTDSQICLLNKFRDELIQQINDYEKECLANVKETSAEFKAFKSFVNEASDKYKKWIEYFKCSDVDDTVISDIINDAKSLRESITKKSDLLGNFIFLNDKATLCQDQVAITSKHIGTFKFNQNINKFHRIFAQNPRIIDYSVEAENGSSILFSPFFDNVFVVATYIPNRFDVNLRLQVSLYDESKLILSTNQNSSHFLRLTGRSRILGLNALCTFNKHILIGTYDSCNRCTVKVLNENLTRFTEFNLYNFCTMNLLSIQSCKEEFYVLKKQTPFIYIYNDQFKLKHSVGQNHDINTPFYIQDITKVKVKDDFIYSINDLYVSKICKTSGQIVQNINIDLTNIEHFEITSDELFFIVNDKYELCIRQVDGEPDIVLLKEAKDVSSMTLTDSSLVLNYESLRNAQIYLFN